MKKKFTSVFLALLTTAAMMFSFTAAAGTVYVKPASAGGSDDAGDGLSWETAYATPNKGLASAVSDDIVALMQGTYLFTAELSTVDTKPTNIKIQGGYTGNGDERVVDPANTIFEYAASAGSTVNRVLSQTYGAGLTFSGITFQNLQPVDSQYGMFAQIPGSGNLTLEDCVVKNFVNIAGSYIRGFFRINATAILTIDRCRFIDCEEKSTASNNAVITRNGGNATVIVRNSLIQGTRTKPFISAAAATGSTHTITNCTFINNPGGAGLSLSANFAATFNNCIFHNSALSGVGTLNNSYYNGSIGSLTGTNNVSYTDATAVFADETDFYPATTFAGIDAGDNTKVVGDKDIAGNARTVNATVDIGAYENIPAPVGTAGNNVTAVGTADAPYYPYGATAQLAVTVASGCWPDPIDGVIFTGDSPNYTAAVTVKSPRAITFSATEASYEVTVITTKATVTSPALTDGKFNSTANSTIYFTIDEGTEITSVTVNDVPATPTLVSGNDYLLELTGLTGATTVVITATTAPTYEVTVVTTHATVTSPALTDGKYISRAASTLYFTIDEGTEITAVTINDVPATPILVSGNNYRLELTGLTSAATVVITAAKKWFDFTITTEGIDNASLSVTGLTDSKVEYGSGVTLSFALAADKNYPYVLVNGAYTAPAASNGVYTLSLANVTAAQTVKITGHYFAENELPVTEDTYYRYSDTAGNPGGSSGFYANYPSLFARGNGGYVGIPLLRFVPTAAQKAAGYEKATLKLVFSNPGNAGANSYAYTIAQIPATYTDINNIVSSGSVASTAVPAWTQVGTPSEATVAVANEAISLNVADDYVLGMPDEIRLAVFKGAANNYVYFHSLENGNPDYIPVLVFSESASDPKYEVTVIATHATVTSPELTDGKYISPVASTILFTIDEGTENPSVTVNDVPVTPTLVGGNNYSVELTGLSGATTVVITAAKKQFDFTLITEGIDDASLSLTGVANSKVEYGSDVTLSFALAAGKNYPYVVVNGAYTAPAASSGVYSLSFSNVTAAQTVKIQGYYFAENELPVTEDTYYRYQGPGSSLSGAYASETSLRAVGNGGQAATPLLRFVPTAAQKAAGYNKAALKLVFSGLGTAGENSYTYTVGQVPASYATIHDVPASVNVNASNLGDWTQVGLISAPVVAAVGDALLVDVSDNYVLPLPDEIRLAVFKGDGNTALYFHSLENGNPALIPVLVFSTESGVGIGEAGMEADSVTGVKYYDLTGRQIVTPSEKGAYIIQKHYLSGKKVSTKVIRR